VVFSLVPVYLLAEEEGSPFFSRFVRVGEEESIRPSFRRREGTKKELYLHKEKTIRRRKGAKSCSFVER